MLFTFCSKGGIACGVFLSQPLSLFKLFVADDTELRSLNNNPVLFTMLVPLICQRAFRGLSAVDNFPDVDLIGKDFSDGRIRPSVLFVLFRLDAVLVEILGDTGLSPAVLRIAIKDKADGFGFFRIRLQRPFFS